MKTCRELVMRPRKPTFWRSNTLIGRGAAIALAAGLLLVFIAGAGLIHAATAAQPPGQPEPMATWFFAEGATHPPFDTWFLVQNPTGRPASVRFTFFLEPSGTVVRDFTVGPTTRFSLFANQVVPNAAFATRIESDQAVLAERAMYAGFDGHAVTGIAAPDRLWLFAEGATVEPFHTWLLLQNPNAEASAASVTFLLDNGQAVRRALTLPASSRTSIFVNQVLPDAAFATRVESALPIIAERAIYRFPGNAATGVAGVNAPSATWFFADGRNSFFRGQDADTWLLLQNPSSSPVTATATFYSSEGVVERHQFELVPTSRLGILLDQVFQQPTYGIAVEASDEIIAERSVFVGQLMGRPEPKGTYAVTGTPRLGTVWAFPEGSTAAPFGETIVLLNPNDRPMAAHFDFMLPSGQVATQDITVEPNRRSEVDVNAFLPNTAVSVRVITDLPSVAERVMFFGKDGSMGFHGVLGIRLQ